MSTRKAVRIRQQVLQTPICTFTKGNQRVVFVGISHIGTKTYYQELSALVERHTMAGYRMLYESNPYRAPPSPTFLKTHRKKFAIYHQMGELPVKKDWLDADLPTEEIFKILKSDWAKVERMTRAGTKSSKNALEMIDSLRAEFAQCPENVSRFSFKKFSEDYREMLAKRDAFAVQKILEVCERQPVITCWGGVHLVGIGNLLEAQGFKRSRIRWISALHTGLEPLK